MSELLLAWGLAQACPYSLMWVHGIEAAVYRPQRSGRVHLRNRNHPVTNKRINRANSAVRPAWRILPEAPARARGSPGRDDAGGLGEMARHRVALSPVHQRRLLLSADGLGLPAPGTEPAS